MRTPRTGRAQVATVGLLGAPLRLRISGLGAAGAVAARGVIVGPRRLAPAARHAG